MPHHHHHHQEHHAQRLSRSPSWWERSIVKRSTYAIDNLVDTMMAESSFLQKQKQESSSSSSSEILVLDRSQVQLGAMLGKGSFSVVSEVTGLNLDDGEADKDKADTDASGPQDEEHHDGIGNSSASSGDLCLQSMLSHLVEDDDYDDDDEEDDPIRHSYHHHSGSRKRPQYAMKHLRPDLIPRNGDPEHFQAAAADLLMEAKYLAAFDHPGILKLRAVAQGGSSAFQSNGGDYDGFFIITDRLHGTLKDKIIEWQCQQQEESLLECLQMAANQQQQQQQQQPRAWEEESKDEDMTAYSSANHGNNSTTYNPRRVLLEKVDLALQLAQALLYLHDRRLIYRDLKPQNIGLTKDNTVQLFDFGFCRELPPCNFIPFDAEKDSNNANNEEEDDDLLYYMSGKGSLMYLAPEVLHNGRYNRKADCYSFAMVFYELLTLNKPFTTVTNQQIFRELIVRHKARPSLEFAEIPMPIQDLLRHAWNHSVSQRWTMKQICERLEEIMVDLKREEEQEARPVPASPSEQQHMIAPSSSSAPMCGGAGLVLDLVMDFARDVRLGFEILTGKHKTLALERESTAATTADEDVGFRSSPTEQSDSVSVSPEDDLAVPVAQERAVSPIERQGTAETVSSSSGSFSGASSLHVHVTPMTATEEPFEVTLEQAITMSPSHKENAQPAAAEDQRIDEHSSEKVMDERCPPSPPMERTASAPVNSHGNSSSSHGKTASMNVLGDIQVPYGRLPEEQQKAIMKPSRRQSYHGSGGLMTRGVLPAIPTPEKSRRRASSQGGKYADDGPQWISSVQAF